MKNKIIASKDIAAFVDGLTPEYWVFAPVAENGQAFFRGVASGGDVSLDYANTVNSPKGIFFSQAETLFAYSVGKKGEMKIRPPAGEAKRVLFGVRPCDAKSLLLMDSVFDGESDKDPYYLKKREATVIIGMGCVDPQSTCFCDSLEGGPFAAEALDVLLTDIGDSYVVEAVTQKGEEFLSAIGGLADAADEDNAQAEKVRGSASDSMNSGVKVDGIKEKLDRIFDDAFWEDLHEKCLGCGICTYLCPTCHCFDIIDEARGSEGERIRIWDSCQFCLFTQETSGHNPRPASKERLRQRLMHNSIILKIITTSMPVWAVAVA